MSFVFLIFISVYIYNHFYVKLVNIYENILEFNKTQKNPHTNQKLQKLHHKSFVF